MNNLLSYSGINTKIRAMEANFITIDEFYKISNLETVVDFIAYIKAHPGYRELFGRYDEHEINRSEAERILINALYLDYAKIYRFANEEQRKDLDFIFFRFEVNIIKTCIRFMNSEDTYDLSIFQPFFSRHSKLNVSALAASHSMDECISKLKGTEYYSLLVKLQNINHINSFDYEMQLDTYYFTKVWKLKDKHLSGDTLKSYTQTLGTQIDLLNIMWIYRLKANFDMNSTDILANIIPVNYRLSKEQLIKLANAATLDEFIVILKNCHYKTFSIAISDGTMESAYRSILNRSHKACKEKYPSSMAAVNYYLYLKNAEISRLTTALECIRYSLDSQNKLKFILA